MMTRLRRLFRRMLIICVILALLILLSVLLPRGYAAWKARGQVYTVKTVPPRPVAIIFGAAVRADGTPTAMLADRVQVGAELYFAGKVQVLLMTGDNSTHDHNEPAAMRRYAMQLGVPDSAIVLDYAGFRTYDSCYRAREIFQVDSAILVTQEFHLDRALLICNQLGVDSIGVVATRSTGYSRDSLLFSQLREYPATGMALVDLISDRKPTFLGPREPIFPR
jgi:SanA protein